MGCDRTEASSFRTQSLRGHTHRWAEGFPRHYPPSIACPWPGSRCGLRRYERVIRMESLPCRATIYPTRNFATLGTLVTSLRRWLRRLEARSFLPGSACRHAGRTVSSPPISDGASRAVSEDPFRFPADCPHRMDCHCLICSDEYHRILGGSSIQRGFATASNR